MSVWTLIIIFAVGSNASVSVSITNIGSLQECQRVLGSIKEGPIASEYRFARTASQCVESK